MAVPYKCSYCGSTQTWSGTGPRVCASCGATQPEKPGSTSPGSTTTETAAPPRRRGVRLVVWSLVLLAVLFGAVLLGLRHSGRGAASNLPNVAIPSRMLSVNNPPVRSLPAGSDMSAIDLVRSAPANAGKLFDTKLLAMAKPRPMNDTEGNLWYVGEVINHSPDRTAVAPAVQLAIVKGGHIVETRDLSFGDLPPNGHVPVAFQWGGESNEVENIVFRWRPVVSAVATRANRLPLEVNVEDRKMLPGSVTVNFSYTFHYTTAKLHGTVVNRSDKPVQGVVLYLTLYDTKNRVTGFKAQKLNSIAPGEQLPYDIEAEQWGGPIGVVDIEALPGGQAALPGSQAVP